MPALTYASWPFRSLTARLPDEAAQWWAQCYCPPSAGQLLAGWANWRVIVGVPGSGKSTVLAMLEQQEQATRQSFIVRYPPTRWPGTRQTLVEGGNHLAQIMAAIALRLRDHFSVSPSDLAALKPGQQTALRWMMDYYLGSRAFSRWIDGLSDEVSAPLRVIDYTPLYTSTTRASEVIGQIDEAVGLVRRLGFQRIMLTVDVNTREAQLQISNLGELFSWLELMEQPGLVLVAAVPRHAADEADLVGRARGRVDFARLDWSEDLIWQIADRHLQAALSDPAARLDRLVAASALPALAEWLVAEFGGFAPQGWVWLTETVLHCARTRPAEWLLGDGTADRVWRELCARHFPLELVTGRGVWRGPRFIPLDPQPLRLTEILWHSREPVNIDYPGMEALLRKGKSKKGLLHSLARRVREAIEPDPSHPIYLVNDRGEGGYSLENIVRASPASAM